MSDTNEKKIICPNCKSEIPADNRFCPQCGLKIKEEFVDKQIPKEQNNEQVKEQEVPAPSNEPVVKIHSPKPPAPKKPSVWGGIVATIVAASLIAAVLFIGGDDNSGLGNPPGGNGHEHSYGEWTIVDDPTCTETGLEERVCECDEKETRPVEALGHTVVVDDAVEATCKATGLTAGKHCSICGTIIVAQSDVAKVPHVYSGDSDIDCNTCGEIRVVGCSHTETEIIHGKDATCKATGLTDGIKCKTCDETIVAQETIPLSAHTYDNKYDEDCNICGHKRDAECAHAETEVVKGKAATCTATGLTDGTKCKKCGETIVAQSTIPVKAHNETTIPAVSATCAETGLTTGSKCSVCNKTLVAQQEIPKTAHTYDDKYDDTCNKCGFVRDAECAHTETETVKGYEATCTATGLTDGTKCKKCGEIIVAQSTAPMKAHAEVIDTAVEATCTSTGLTQGKHCSVCNKILVAQTTIPAKAHTEVIDPAVAATCKSTGLTEGKHCSVCNKVILAQTQTSRIGHISSDWIVDKEASVSEAGLRHTECTMCGRVMIEETLPATGSLGLAYTINLDGTSCTITGIGTCTDTEIYINPSINGYKVTAIADKAFEYNQNITQIILPNTLETIGEEAFLNCGKLAEITIPHSVTRIGRMAFAYCYSSSFTSIILPDSLTSIEPALFMGCHSLTTVHVPDSVTSIGEQAFHWCYSLTDINIPNSVTSIDFWAFSSCTSLVSIDIPRSVVKLHMSSFSWCENLTAIYYAGTIEEWSVIEKIGTPEGLGECSVYCINGNVCVNHSEVVDKAVTATCTSSGLTEGKHCSVCGSIIVAQKIVETTGHYIEGDTCVFCKKTCEELCINFYDMSSDSDGTVIGYILKSPDEPGFYHMYVIGSGDMKNYSASKSPIKLDGYNTKITKLIMSEGITSIGNYTFEFCDYLERVDIPSTVVSIGHQAFYECDLLTYITLSQNIKYIGSNAFYRTAHYSNTDNWYRNMYYIDDVLVEAKTTISGNHTLKEGTKTIVERAFENCSELTGITIPNTVVAINSYAFAGCTKLSTVMFEANSKCKEIGHWAFYDTKIKSIDIPKSVIYIDTYAFYYCGKLENIEVEQENTKYKSIDGVLFNKEATILMVYPQANSKTEYVVPSMVNRIEEWAFSYASNLATITINANVTEIGMSAFIGCSKLATVIFENTVGWTMHRYNSEETIKMTESMMNNPVPYLTNVGYMQYSWIRR